MKKNGSIEGYKSMSKDKLLSILDASEPVKKPIKDIGKKVMMLTKYVET